MESYYEEEYEAATPLIASILWGNQSERSQIVQQLETLNTQISAKNKALNLRLDEGLIIIPAFSIAADILQEASLQLLNSRDTAKFHEVEKYINSTIDAYQFPIIWKIDRNGFLDYHFLHTGDDLDSLRKSGLFKDMGDPREGLLLKEESKESLNKQLFDDGIHGKKTLNKKLLEDKSPNLSAEELKGESSEGESSEGESSDGAFSEGELSESELSEGELSEDESSEGESSEGESSEEDLSEGESSEGESSEGESSEGELPDGASSESESSEDEFDGESSDGELSEGESSEDEFDGESSDGELSEGESSEGESSEKDLSEGESSEGELSEGESSDGEFSMTSHSLFGNRPRAQETELDFWQDSAPLDTVRQSAQREFRLVLAKGFVLGSPNDHSVIVGYTCEGLHTARVKPKERYKDQPVGPSTHEVSSRQNPIEGVGLVAWEAETWSDTVASIFPTEDASYPPTFIWIKWENGEWTWESRDVLKAILEDLTSFEVDLLIYHMAISQEASFQEKLCGERPSFPSPRT